MWNWVLGHSLPGIKDCGLWMALDERPPVPTVALVTDVGNDLLYGASVETILRWVEACLARLQPRCEQVVISELPLASIRRIKPRHYYLLRRILFPPSRLSFDEAQASAAKLNAGLIELAKNFSCLSVHPRDDWFGFDPIHVRRSRAAEAWQAYLSPWRAVSSAGGERCARRGWLSLRMARPHDERWFGWRRGAKQPALAYADGGSVWLY
jgi:hypothetical protein